MVKESYYSLGTALYEETSSEADLIANAVIWLLKKVNPNGTWGSSDSLDNFITTNHVVMALLSVGFSASSKTLKRAIDYLVDINKDEIISFFWRAGTLLNQTKFSAIVKDDMEYIWNFRKRVGVHKDYPIPFFLLKLLRFSSQELDISFTYKDVLKWILDEWDDEKCWYDRTSITSMALALIYDLQFKGKKSIVDRSIQFLEDRFTDLRNGTGYFSGNIVDDCFLIFNLCERDLLEKSNLSSLKLKIQKTTAWVIDQCHDRAYWESPPPFGGSIGAQIYPTAVVVRALLSYFCTIHPHFINQISSLLLEQEFNNHKELKDNLDRLQPFWGDIDIGKEQDICFVLMPFSPPKLTEIYQRYIKEPVELGTNLKCIRADDIYKSTEIMKDIWECINKAKYVIADLTTKNPNVFYELGMAHVLGKNVILISQSMEDIPFDLRGIRTIIYEDRPSGYEYLSKQVINFILQSEAQVSG